MKAFFLTVVAFLVCIATVRFSYGLAPNEFTYVINTVLSLPPDVKEEFQIVIDAAQGFVSAIDSLRAISSGGADIFEVVRAFFNSIAAFINIPLVFVQFLVNMVGHLLKVLRTLFNLLFGPAVAPIVAPTVS